MKKLLFSVALISASFFSNAQFSLGPKIGFGLANLKSTGPGVTNSSKGGIAPTIGLDMKIDIVKYFSIQPSVQGQILGSNNDQTVGGKKYRVRNYLGYIQVPVKFNVQYPISDKMTVGFGAGPYIGYFVAGAQSTPDNQNDSGTKLKGKANVTVSDIKDNPDDAFINPLDYGVVLAPFFQIGVLNIAPTMSFGMNNINPKYEGTTYPIVTKNVYYGLQISFLFGGK
jgi:hypothetical protein